MSGYCDDRLCALRIQIWLLLPFDQAISDPCQPCLTKLAEGLDARVEGPLTLVSLYAAVTARDTTVVTFRADRADEYLAGFAEWAGRPVVTEDLGTRDGRRRYRVDAVQWRAYTREKAPTRSTQHYRRFRCAECGVEAVSGALNSHQRASGHEGRVDLGLVSP